ncbi:YggS family pyridoxal phosphate-dependent enzyme [Parabacteroides sp. PF5-9]|uniref:YggS family pyridoxal phosphate-dependent enzyme n=1 Tax=Parabacteroides sp. PF5-9 TaxID=1742404 RepID=UPI002476D9E8|nr:YggS family pyridoxal phosphate-dependent enzyme [Parabacteroides sp. PF5-9]MDH6358065.1 pyridoxal phosphate enzyme (YggS family) [Parabacteroides sp. PF5-9]
MNIAQRIHTLKASLPQEVTLVAVSKFHPADAVMEAYYAGQRIFGESRAQELTAKQKLLPNDIEWHFIGTLQRNKVKEIIPFIDMIHSVDSLRLLEEIDKQAAKHHRVVRILLEIYVAQEETKHGLSPDECRELLQHLTLNDYPNVQICGLMGMATYTEDELLIEKEFKQLHALFVEMKETYFSHTAYFTELSMGMSHDYPIAIQEGSTMIRVGSHIFGERHY